MIQLFKLDLSHESKGTKECPAKVVEAGVVVVGVLAEALKASVVVRAGAGPAHVPAQQVVLCA